MHEAIRRYHLETRHRPEAYAPGPGFLDWDSQPDPFRRFADAPVIALPLAPAVLGCRVDEAFSRPAAGWSLAAAGQLLELAFGLSGWKVSGPDRWAVRQNPSSGNLHPTESYLLNWTAVPGLPAGLYHYQVDQHQLVRRADWDAATAARLARTAGGGVAAIGLSSVLWREEWKYGARAWRYTQLDHGHALGALSWSAATLGYRAATLTALADAHCARWLGLDRAQDFVDVEAERPEALVWLGAGPDEGMASALTATLSDPSLGPGACWHGRANRLSAESLQWPHSRRLLPAVTWDGAADRVAPTAGLSAEPASAWSAGEDLGVVLRRRRSVARMDREGSTLSAAGFRELLAGLNAGEPALTVLGGAAAIVPLLYVHKVAGLAPGLYLYERHDGQTEALRQVTAVHGDWQPVAGFRRLFRHRHDGEGLRQETSRICCHQGIAGQGALAIGLLADLSAVGAVGARYARLFREAGLLGQQLYVLAEHLGLQGTGIGCFFDEAVTGLLGLPDAPDGWQALYHFTIGQGRPETRLVSEPPFAHLDAARRPLDDEAGLRAQIAATWATREAIKADLAARGRPVREVLARLARVDALLSSLDTRFKALWDSRHGRGVSGPDHRVTDSTVPPSAT